MKTKIFFIIILFLLFFLVVTLPLIQASPIKNFFYKTAIFLGIIEITNANHLNSDRVVVSDIYEQVKSLDEVWSEEISDRDYVRVTFEKNLTSENDITIYPRVISGVPKIEVYEKNKNELIAKFETINSNQYNKVFLTNLIGEQDTFDLKILDGSLEFNHIIDPEVIINYINASIVEKESTDIAYSTCTASNVYVDDTSYCGNDLSIDGGEYGYVNSTHPYNVPSTATMNNVTICTRFFLTSKLDDNAADTTEIYVGENSTGSWIYTLVDSCISTGCTAWETEATRCYEVTNTINTSSKASNIQISIYVYQADADNNQYPSVDWNYVYLNYTSADTCTCAGLNNNWEINMGDYCNITSTCNLGTGNITFTGTGTTIFNATISLRDLEYPTTNQNLNIGSNAIITIG